MNRFSLLATVAYGAIFIVITACSGGDNAVSYKAGDMTHTIAEGKSAVPADFPLPIYTKTTPAGIVSSSGQQSDENSHFLILTSPDSVTDIKVFYTEKLKADGWSVGNIQEFPSMFSIAASKGLLEGNVMISRDQDETTISLAVSQASPGKAKPADEIFYPEKLSYPLD